MGRGREALVMFVIVPIAVVAIAGSVTVTKQSNRLSASGPTGKMPAISLTQLRPEAAPAAPIETIPPVPRNPSAFTIVPKNYSDKPPELIVAAKSVVARWKAWKAKPVGEVIPYGDWYNARSNLIAIKPSDPEFAEAKALAAQLDSFGLELANAEIRAAPAIRAKGEAKVAAALYNNVDGRKAYAYRLEENFLRSGMDVHVTPEGDKGTTLRVKYVLFSRPLMFKLQEEGKLIPDIIDQAKARGFRKLIMWNGYDLSWTWDLTKS
jgi:hypothetical protein